MRGGTTLLLNQPTKATPAAEIINKLICTLVDQSFNQYRLFFVI
jgi:hypothetical protein